MGSASKGFGYGCGGVVGCFVGVVLILGVCVGSCVGVPAFMAARRAAQRSAAENAGKSAAAGDSPVEKAAEKPAPEKGPAGPVEKSPGSSGAAGGAEFVREWVDRSGQFRVTASFVKLEEEKVYLKKADGRVVSVALWRLSEHDQVVARRLHLGI